MLRRQLDFLYFVTLVGRVAVCPGCKKWKQLLATLPFLLLLLSILQYCNGGHRVAGPSCENLSILFQQMHIMWTPKTSYTRVNSHLWIPICLDYSLEQCILITLYFLPLHISHNSAIGRRLKIISALGCLVKMFLAQQK